MKHAVCTTFYLYQRHFSLGTHCKYQCCAYCNILWRHYIRKNVLLGWGKVTCTVAKWHMAKWFTFVWQIPLLTDFPAQLKKNLCVIILEASIKRIFNLWILLALSREQWRSMPMYQRHLYYFADFEEKHFWTQLFWQIGILNLNDFVISWVDISYTICPRKCRYG